MNRMPELQMVPVLTASPPGRAENVMEDLLLSLIDGHKTISQLGDACGIDGDMAQRIVSKLQESGVLQIMQLSKAACCPADVEGTNRTSGARSASEGATASVSAAEPSNGHTMPDSAESLFCKIDSANYYEMLGVIPTATRAEIRNAYFALSKKYHPDSHFREADEELKQKFVKIFDRITVAYDALSGKKRRKEYDESISDEISMWKMEYQLQQAVQPVAQPITSPPVVQNSTRESSQCKSKPIARSSYENSSGHSGVKHRLTDQTTSSAPKTPSTTAYRRTPVQDRVSIGVRARVSRVPVTRSSVVPAESRVSSRPVSRTHSFQGQRDSGTTSDSAESGSVSPQEQELRRQQWKRERLKRALNTNSIAPAPRISTGTHFLGKSDAELVEHARIAFERNEYDLAIEHLQEAIRRDGDNTIASSMLREAHSQKLAAKVKEFIRRGRFEQSKGKMNNALELYESALKLDTRNLDAKYHLANVLFESKIGLHRGVVLCQEVIAQGGNKAKYFAMLAEFLILAREEDKAVESMSKAVYLDPDNRDYRKKLKSMKK